MINVETLFKIKDLLQQELTSTEWKEMSGGCEYIEHKANIKFCMDSIDVEVKKIRGTGKMVDVKTDLMVEPLGIWPTRDQFDLKGPNDD